MKNFEQLAAEKSAAICQSIKDGLQKNSHKKDAINLVALSCESGVKNIGKVLNQDAVSLRRVMRILEGLKSLANERGIDISETLLKISNIITQ